MRPTTRLLAKFLEPGAPTGLAGLATHPAPRSTLIYLYSSTISKLQQIPAHSPYRQATEALTRKRLAIIESVVPENYEAWSDRVSKAIQEHRAKSNPDAEIATNHSPSSLNFEGREFVLADMSPFEIDWDTLNKRDEAPLPEGPVGAEVRNVAIRRALADAKKHANKPLKLEPEPRFNVEQIQKLETELSAGLIEEVVQVADGENRLVDVMVENKVWEELCERPPEGQFQYFERNTHTPGTQAIAPGADKP